MTATVTRQDGWAKLFAGAFRESRNAMVLVDEQRRIVDANGAMLKLLAVRREDMTGHRMWEFVADGPLATPAEWRVLLAEHRFNGEADLVCRDGQRVGVQWGATAEVITGRHLVLFVALSTSRWGARFRREGTVGPAAGALSERELEVVRHVARGASGPEIAEELHIAHDTVRTHVRNAMAKVGARSRAHLVAKALGEGHVLR
jgi:PAS domain S-box-containing protein